MLFGVGELFVLGAWLTQKEAVSSVVNANEKHELHHLKATMSTQSLRHSGFGRTLTLKAGALYFALVFATGFALGPIRILWIAPRIGAGTAELLEAPLMLAVSVVAARWVIGRLAVPSFHANRIGMGLIALSLMLITEFTLVLSLRGISIRQYFAERDPVAGTVYYITLGLYTVIPLLLERK